MCLTLLHTFGEIAKVEKSACVISKVRIREVQLYCLSWILQVFFKSKNFEEIINETINS